MVIKKQSFTAVLHEKFLYNNKKTDENFRQPLFFAKPKHTTLAVLSAIDIRCKDNKSEKLKINCMIQIYSLFFFAMYETTEQAIIPITNGIARRIPTLQGALLPGV